MKKNLRLGLLIGLLAVGPAMAQFIPNKLYNSTSFGLGVPLGRFARNAIPGLQFYTAFEYQFFANWSLGIGFSFDNYPYESNVDNVLVRSSITNTPVDVHLNYYFRRGGVVPYLTAGAGFAILSGPITRVDFVQRRAEFVDSSETLLLVNLGGGLQHRLGSKNIVFAEGSFQFLPAHTLFYDDFLASLPLRIGVRSAF